MDSKNNAQSIGLMRIFNQPMIMIKSCKFT
jgi:hypothetical protein